MRIILVHKVYKNDKIASLENNALPHWELAENNKVNAKEIDKIKDQNKKLIKNQTNFLIS